MTAHPVGHDEQSRGIVRSKTVFVLRSNAAHVGAGVKLPSHVLGQTRRVLVEARRTLQRHNLSSMICRDKCMRALSGEFAALSRGI